jgi:putative transferase (TIGR04331 family)
MFLVTTADQRFWKAGERVLFLGEWCRLFRERPAWSRLDADVLPYHWDDRARFHRDFLYGRQVFARYLSALAVRLNALHGVDFSERYWQTVVGWWLTYFVDIVLDRYQSVCAARDSGKVTNTWVEDTGPGTWTPQDFQEFQLWFTLDEYNQQLYGDLVRLDGQIPFEAVTVGPHGALPRPAQAESSAQWKRALKALNWAYARAIPKRWNKVVFVESFLSQQDLLRLQLQLGQWPSPSGRLTTPSALPFDSTRRAALELSCGETPFERALDRLIPAHMPRLYLEGYHEARDAALAMFPRHPRVIFTANAYSSNEAFKLWAAENVERGARLAIWQHGGVFGTARWSSTEEHELAVSDRFYSWGWMPDGDTKTVPVCLGRLNGLKATLKPDPTGSILWVALSAPRYAYLLYSSPTGPQMLDYLAEQRRFLDRLSPDARRLLLLRLYMYDYGWHEAQRWAEWAPDLKTSQGEATMYEQLGRSRLMVATYNSTTYLETFAAGFPTILFWNPRQWELRPQAEPFFERLRHAGIYHDTPESAAAKVSDVWKNPDRWWQSAPVQAARAEFSEEFVRIRSTWLTDLRDDLSGLCS